VESSCPAEKPSPLCSERQETMIADEAGLAVRIGEHASSPELGNKMTYLEVKIVWDLRLGRGPEHQCKEQARELTKFTNRNQGLETASFLCYHSPVLKKKLRFISVYIKMVTSKN
jgi:hypothetical protein